MNRSHLILAALLSLGGFTALSAQDVKLNIPSQPAAAAPTAPAAPAPTFTEPQLLESFGWFVGQRLGLSELGFNKVTSRW